MLQARHFVRMISRLFRWSLLYPHFTKEEELEAQRKVGDPAPTRTGVAFAPLLQPDRGLELEAFLSLTSLSRGSLRPVPLTPYTACNAISPPQATLSTCQGPGL